jgi:hypothetical protein
MLELDGVELHAVVVDGAQGQAAGFEEKVHEVSVDVLVAVKFWRPVGRSMAGPPETT